MMTILSKVNLREFRNNMAQHIGGQSPFAVTKHGQTVGYYIPVAVKPTEEDMASLHKAAQAFDGLLADHGINEDEIVAEFQDIRQKDATPL